MEWKCGYLLCLKLPTSFPGTDLVNCFGIHKCVKTNSWNIEWSIKKCWNGTNRFGLYITNVHPPRFCRHASFFFTIGSCAQITHFHQWWSFLFAHRSTWSSYLNLEPQEILSLGTICVRWGHPPPPLLGTVSFATNHRGSALLPVKPCVSHSA